MKKKLFEHIEGNRFKLNESTQIFNTTIELTNGQEVDVNVQYDVDPAEPMVMNPPDKAYPGSEGGINIYDIVDATNPSIEYDESQMVPGTMDSLERQIIQHEIDSAEDPRY